MSLRRIFHVAPLFAALAAGALAVGCSAADDTGAADENDSAYSRGHFSKTDVQLNDVSVLYPLATSQAEVDNGYVKASDTGAHGVMLPEKLYDTATGASPTKPGPVPIGTDVQMDYRNFRVVAFRIDPCFAHIGPIDDPSSCDNQLRVIYQSVSFSGGSSSAVDGAVHAFYRLTRDELVGIVKDLIALRVAENQGSIDLGQLAVHPILVKQGLSGDMAAGLKKIILAHAGVDNLFRFTTFTSANLQTVWHFQGFDIANGKPTDMVIPTLPAETTSVSFFAGFARTLGGGFTPETTSKDDMALLANLDKAKAATAADRQAAFDAALRIENPDMHSPNTIDCASCHLAQPARELTGTNEFKLSAEGNANLFKADSKIPKADLVPSTSVENQSGINVHSFSYKFDKPMINDRVLHETAAVVSYLNTSVLHPTK